MGEHSSGIIMYKKYQVMSLLFKTIEITHLTSFMGLFKILLKEENEQLPM